MLKLAKVLFFMDYKPPSEPNANASGKAAKKGGIENKPNENSKQKESIPVIPLEDSYPLF